MPIERQKPSSSAKENKQPAKSSELSDDDLRSISGGMAARPGVAGCTDPVCISSTSGG